MIRPIMRDILFLSKPSTPATPEDKQVALDLLETLKHNEEAGEASTSLARQLIDLEQKSIQSLKEYL